jgi:DNA integrity scanning protein DisA with diadenylate cyclase activity
MKRNASQSEPGESGMQGVKAKSGKSGLSPTKSAKGGRNRAGSLNAVVIEHAKKIAKEISAAAILAYVEKIHSEEQIKSLIREHRCILAAQTDAVTDELREMVESRDRILRVPHVNMTRASQIKVIVVLALSKGLIRHNQVVICLSGPPGSYLYDSITALNVGREFEIFSSSTLDIASQMENPHVFDRLLTLVLELAQEGKEGKPIGTIFILGDHKKVLDMSSQMAINPFNKVPEDERNIMDSNFKETLREFSTMDGAFVIRDDGVVLAAARHLNVSAETDELPQGLGARHRAAAGITALTNAIALVISESTGMVRIISRGGIFMEIEKRK